MCPKATNDTRHTVGTHRNQDSVYAHRFRNWIQSCQPRLLLIPTVYLRYRCRIQTLMQEVGGPRAFGQSGAIRGNAAFPKRGWMSGPVRAMRSLLNSRDDLLPIASRFKLVLVVTTKFSVQLFLWNQLEQVRVE